MKEWLQHYRAILFFLLIVVILAGLVALQVIRPKAAASILAGLTPAPSPTPSPTPQPLRVYVTGAVEKPDVYALPPGSIVKDAIVAAGGATDDADLDSINLAKLLDNGLQIYVPRLGEAETPAPLRVQTVGTKVNINAASVEELDTLPGIGPVMAQRIVEYRQAHGPFQKIDDLMNVPGIGPVTFEKLRDRITTE